MKPRSLIMALLLAFFVSCGDPDIQYNDDGILKANKVGTKLVLSNLYVHEGRHFAPRRLQKDPPYYLLYYSGSW